MIHRLAQRHRKKGMVISWIGIDRKGGRQENVNVNSDWICVLFLMMTRNITDISHGDVISSWARVREYHGLVQR